MRLDTPRIEPVADEALTPDQRELLESLNPYARGMNLFRTLLHTAGAVRALLPYSNYLGSKDTNSLPRREKEIIVLRTAYKTRCGYEWSHHARIGMAEGLSADEIRALRDDPGSFPWPDKDRWLIALSDELVGEQFVSDATWVSLGAFFTQRQIMDAIYTCSHYTMVAACANSFGIQIDRGVVLDPEMSFPKPGA